MSKELERIYKIDRMIRQRYPPGMKQITEKLEVSVATVKRDLAFLRDRLGAPLLFDRGRGCYRYGDEGFQLPGLWFTQAELSALLVLDRVLQEGPLGPYAKELSQRIHSLLQAGAGGVAEKVSPRIRVTSPGVRRCNPQHFEAICTATVQRLRLSLRYFTRSRKARTERVVSPQQIICYRSNWYFDGWCHRSEGLRRFAMDAIEAVTVLEEPALEAPPMEGSGYGIFSGAAEQTAKLIFEEAASRWVANETWHPQQVMTSLPDGRTQLEVPYSHSQEILMDILRHGPNVEVVAPRSLRSEVAAAHREAALRYEAPRKAMAAGALEVQRTGTA